MRPQEKQGDGERYEAESRGFWDDGWELGLIYDLVSPKNL
jgi:hypothetical protein